MLFVSNGINYLNLTAPSYKPRMGEIILPNIIITVYGRMIIRPYLNRTAPSFITCFTCSVLRA